MLAKLNVWLRTANRVYLEAAEGKTEDFDRLYELVKSVDWTKYVPQNAPILVDVVSETSYLESIPAIQRTAKKAVIDRLTVKKGMVIPEVEGIPPFGILLLIRKNECLVLINSSGEALGRRGYRIESGEAPIKETLAAAIVMLAHWKYSDVLLDPFCGSGTIAIEAAMIARNMAPGSGRYFAFEGWNWYAKEHKKAAIESQKSYPSGKYRIIASDIDTAVVEAARSNALRAGVSEDIEFRIADANSYRGAFEGCLVTNPPYGIRLQDFDTEGAHKLITDLLRNESVYGGAITAFDAFLKTADRQ